MVGEVSGSIGGLMVWDSVELLSAPYELEHAEVVGKSFTVLEVFNEDNVLLDNNYWFSKKRLKKIP